MVEGTTYDLFSVPALDCFRILFLALNKNQMYIYLTLSFTKVYTSSAQKTDLYA